MDILFKGWLEVRNAKMPIWRRRFCELRLAAGAEMRCYSVETDTADDNRRAMKSIYFIESLQDWNGQGRVFSYDEARALAIRTRDGKVIQVVCPSGHAREQWKAQIARALPAVEGALAAAQAEEPAAALAHPDHVSIEHFSLLKVLGRGSFGKVMLVRKLDDGKLFAMKSLQKRKIFKLKQFEHVLTERSVALNIQHPFLVNLCYAFQTAEKLYLVLEFMGGGDVFHWLQEAGTFSASRVRLYASEIILDLGELHSKDIIFRDLKPENLMLDLEGHIHITDFGLAKANVSGIGEEGGARTLCGSPEYVAPEILRGRRHGKAVDWWSLGCVLYEMLYGTPPFYSTNKRQMFEQTLRAPVRLPASTPESTRSLILGLLQRDVAKRLGSGETAGLAAQGGVALPRRGCQVARFLWATRSNFKRTGISQTLIGIGCCSAAIHQNSSLPQASRKPVTLIRCLPTNLLRTRQCSQAPIWGAVVVEVRALRVSALMEVVELSSRSSSIFHFYIDKRFTLKEGCAHPPLSSLRAARPASLSLSLDS